MLWSDFWAYFKKSIQAKTHLPKKPFAHPNKKNTLNMTFLAVFFRETKPLGVIQKQKNGLP